MADVSKIIDVQVKGHQVHVEHKDPVQQIKKKVVPTSLEAEQRAEHARKSAHKLTADVKREISMDIKNKLSESFDFIEESCGSGEPTFEFYDEPKMVTEGLEDGAPSYPIIGRASGVFAPIGVMSRNNRIYDNDHYDYLLENQQLVDRIAHRGMLGTIGHHDKKVDDQDLAEGKVSHIVTNLRIVEEADGSRNLYGTLEILDTPAGHLLKTYYDSGVPLFVSSRGGGNLLPVPNESYKRVDKTKYFLETFDIVKNPGFLQAKPVYEKVSESAEEEVYAVVDQQPSAEEIIESLEAQPDKLDKLTEALTNFINTMTNIQEADKKVNIEQEKPSKGEATETKEAPEAKEAKQKSEAKEAPENIGEAKEDDKKKADEKKSEEKKKEDEKNDDEESAVADSVLEGKENPPVTKEVQRLADKMSSDVKGLNKKAIEKGYKQTDMFTPQQYLKMAMDSVAAKKARQKEAKDFANEHPHQETTQKQPEYVQQGLFCSKEELANKLRSAIDEKIESEYDKNMKIANDYDKQFMREPANAPDGTPNPVANHYKSKYQEYFDRAMAAKQQSNPNNGVRPTTPQQKASAGKMNYMKEVNRKMNDNNSKIEKALQAIEEADKKIEQQPVALVKAVGDSTKSAQEANPEIKEPVTCDRLEFARALKAKVINSKRVEV